MKYTFICVCYKLAITQVLDNTINIFLTSRTLFLFENKLQNMRTLEKILFLFIFSGKFTIAKLGQVCLSSNQAWQVQITRSVRNVEILVIFEPCLLKTFNTFVKLI